MQSLVDRYSPFQLWLATVLGLVGTFLVGILAFPRVVYEGFLWRYFWWPVVVDATLATCAVRHEGQTQMLMASQECAQATGYVAYSGYTTVSTLSYGVILILALLGVWFLLRRLDVGDSPGFFYSLLPIMLFGGALRTLEDANIALLRDGAAPVFSFPWVAFVISPFIYFTMFFLTLIILIASVYLARKGIVERYEYPIVAAGTILLAATLGYLGWLTITTPLLTFNALVPTIVLGGAVIITAIVWVLIERYYPSINAGTGYMGAVVIWGHTVDGIANVLSLDWGHVLGLPTYTPKHVINRLIVDVTGQLQPAGISETIGTAWPFLFVKIAAAVIVVWVFDEQLLDESPRYAILLLIAVLAVGIGPGTRDFLRATFGI